jgi:hypothetical protein
VSTGGVESSASSSALERPQGQEETEIHFRIEHNGSVLRNGSVLTFSFRVGLDTEWTEL